MRIKKLFILLIIVSMLPYLSMTGSAATDSLSDVIGIINNSVIMCAQSPMYLAKGIKSEYTIYPKIAASDILVGADVTAKAFGGSLSVNGSSFSIAVSGKTITGYTGQSGIKVNSVSYTLPSPAQTIEGTLYVSADLFSYCGQPVYKSTSSGLVVIGTGVSQTQDARLTGLFGVYVSVNGNDQNSGAPLFPVATISKARDIVRTKHSTTGVSSYGTNVYIHGGIYRQADKIDFTSSDYSTAYKAFGDGEVNVKGSVSLARDEFSAVADSGVMAKLPVGARGKVKEIDLASKIGAVQDYAPPSGPMNSDVSYYELFVNQTMQTLARWPNDDYTTTGTIINDGTTTTKPIFTYSGTHQNLWAGAQYTLLMGYWGQDWACQPLFIDSVNTADKTITLYNAPTYTIRPSARYYAFNLIEELDIPGEWYIDKNTNKLYYYPVDDFQTGDIELSYNSNELFKLSGSSNIAFEGISFENNRAVAINVYNCQNIKIDKCKIAHIGQMGVKINGGKAVWVQDCDIFDIGGVGVYLNGGTRITLTPGEHKVENCHIYNFGRLYRTYAGGVDIFGAGNTVKNNSIHDTPHLALRFSGNDQTIEYNEIYNAVRETKDAGSIYCGRDWTMRGTQLQYNYIHDILSNITNGTGLDAEAIYLDDMYSGVKVFGNVIARANRASLIGGGRDNIFSNNIMIDTTRGLYYDERGKFGGWSHSSTLPSGTMYTNLMSIINNASYNQSLWYGKYPKLEGLVQEVNAQAADPTNSTKDAGLAKGATVTNNVYIGASVNNSGFESIANSVKNYGTVQNNAKYTSISSLGFTDPANQNYTLSPGSVIYTALPGFTPIPFENIGINRAADMGDIAPQLRYPQSNETLTSADIDFSWHKRSGADKYRLIVSENQDLSAPVFDGFIDNGSKRIEGFEQGKYYWRVDGINTSNVLSKTSVGEVSGFTVDNQMFINFDGIANGTAVEEIPGFSVTYTNKADKDGAVIDNGTLKIVKDHSVLNSVMNIALDNFARKGNSLEVEYKIRFERATQGAWLPAVEGLKDGVFQNYALNNIIDGNDYKVRYSVSNLYLSILSGISNIPAKWTKIKCVIDPLSDKYDVYMDDTPVSMATMLPVGYDINEIGNLLFKLSTASVTNAQDIIYIDDIRIKASNDILPTAFIPAGGNINSAARTGTFSVDFNAELNPASVNAQTVTLENGGENIPVNLECVESSGIKRRINITPIQPLKSATNYILRLKEGISSLADINLKSEYTFAFRTEYAISIETLPAVLDKNGRKITTLIASSSYTAKLYFKNNSQQQPQNAQVILALKDAQGSLVYVSTDTINIAANTTYTFVKSFTTPPQTAAGWKMYCYLWENAGNMTPLYMGKVMLP